jgi:hypothetical protein
MSGSRSTRRTCSSFARRSSNSRRNPPNPLPGVHECPCPPTPMPMPMPMRPAARTRDARSDVRTAARPRRSAGSAVAATHPPCQVPRPPARAHQSGGVGPKAAHSRRPAVAVRQPKPPNPKPCAPVRLWARRAFPADRRVAVGTAAADGAVCWLTTRCRRGRRRTSSRSRSTTRPSSSPTCGRRAAPPVNSLWLVPSCRRAALAQCDRADP